jgi:hypothetical protein
LLGHLVYDTRETVAFRCRYPVQPDPFVFYAELREHFLEQRYSAGCFYITFQVMAFAGMSAADENTVSPLLKSFYDERRFYTAAAHDTDYT